MRARVSSAALLFASLAACHGSSKADPPPEIRLDLATATAQEKAGAQVFAKYCALCHGQHAEGYAADNAPSLASTTFRETVSDSYLREAIEHGRPGTAMAGYAQAAGGPLAPADIDALVAFVHAGGPPSNPPYATPVHGNAENGQRLYEQNCATCHGTQMQRATAVHLANPALLGSATDAFLRVAVERGRPGTRMQAWGEKLAPNEIDDVVAYVRSMARAVPPVPQPPAAALVPPPPAAPGTVPSVAPAPPPPPPMPEPDKLLPMPAEVVLNPKGGAPEFKLKEDLYVPVAQVAKAFEKKQRIVMIDARTPSDYLRLHITGAVSVPYYDMKDLAKIPNDGTWVVAYCACPHHVSGTVVEELRKRGYKHTAVLDEGVFFWQQQGHPVVAAEGQLPVAAPPPLTFERAKKP